MKNVLAMVLAGGRVDELSVLTLSRPKSALPFGGMFRVIDFPLSNLMHSGIEKVGILSQYRSFSVINHVGVGSWWDFVGRDRGATLLLPSTGHKVSEWYRGTADAVYQNLDFVRENNPETVMILSGDHVYKMNYGPMLEFHNEKNADVTVAFMPIDPEKSSRFGMAEIDNEGGELGGRVLQYAEKPEKCPYKWASLTIFLFRPEVLYRLLDENARNAVSHEFGRDLLPKILKSHKVYGYKFHGYWGYTRTVDEYWHTTMDLLGNAPKIALRDWQVRTNLDHDQLRERPPAFIADCAHVENSLVHSGCRIEGEVCNSVIFPGVTIRKGAVVKNSILFFNSRIGERAALDQVIADFDVEIGSECVIGEGDVKIPNRDAPDILKSGLTLIGKGASVPPGIAIGKNCVVSPELAPEHFERQKYESGVTI